MLVNHLAVSNDTVSKLFKQVSVGFKCYPWKQTKQTERSYTKSLKVSIKNAGSLLTYFLTLKS